MKKALWVLTDCFPFGTGETFLENEIPYWNSFDEVYLCPLAIRGPEQQTARPYGAAHVRLIDLRYQGVPGVQKAIEALKIIVSRDFWKELPILIKKRGFCPAAIKEVFRLSMHASVEAQGLLKLLDDCLRQGVEIVVYAYWLYLPALVAVQLKRRCSAVALAVSRAHRFDLYEEETGGYLPYRPLLLGSLDGVFAVSEHGRAYLQKRYPAYQNRIQVARLGTMDHGLGPVERQAGALKIVSCSNCRAVKRIDRIIDALALMRQEGHALEWTHYGDGPLLDALREAARDKLGDQVRFSFRGRVANPELMAIYRATPYDCFVNASESEGVPVSIMEALSLGIPAIATNVGGNAEVVVNGQSGYLLDERCEPSQLAERFHQMLRMEEGEALTLRRSTRAYWQQAFCAEKNYSMFFDKLLHWV